MIYGIDISHWQGQIDLNRVRAEGYDFVIIKATQGNTFTDANFARNVTAARSAGLLYAAYHYQVSGVSAAAQAAHIARVIPRDCPVILDVEDGGGTATLTRDLNGRLNADGFHTPLLYLPQWYWQQIGSPSLSGLPPLWYSRYPNNRAGAASTVYAANASWLNGLWGGYGGVGIEVLQFTDQGSVAGTSPVDCNAYRGTRDQLATLLGGGATTFTAPAPVEDDVQPDERAALFQIQNELLGPRGPQGQIQGWPTALGPRTIVAMMLEMFNTWQPGRQPKGVGWKVWPIDALFDANSAVFQTKAAVEGLRGGFDAAAQLLAQAGSGLTEDQIKTAISEGVQEGIRNGAVTVDVNVAGPTRAEGDGDAGAADVADAREQIQEP